MQGVRPIGADNKIFLSEQAPTEYFIIHSCMSHSNSKIVAISTVKHLSRNYASFQQPSVQEWYSLSTSGQTQSIFKIIPLTFMEMDTFLQNAGFTKGLRIAFVVCDVNSEYRHIQVNSADFKVFLPYTFIIQIHFLHIYPWIYQLAYLHIITKQRFCHLVLLLTVTRRVTKQLR